MAKENSILKIRGTLQDLTFVDSKAYGRHVRSKRGTVKPAKVNKAFEKSGEDQKRVIPYAKMIKDPLEPFRQNHKDGTMWTRLLSFFRREIKDQKEPNLLALEGFECNKIHSLEKLANPRVSINFKKEEMAASVTVSLQTARFPVSKIDRYQMTVIALMINSASKTTVSHSEILQVSNLEDPLNWQTAISVENDTDVLLVCLKIEGSYPDRLSENQKAKGMRIVKAVRIEG